MEICSYKKHLFFVSTIFHRYGFVAKIKAKMYIYQLYKKMYLRAKEVKFFSQ